MRCLFCMFAEDVGLLPDSCFKKLLESMRGREPSQFVAALERLWAEMDRGEEYSGFTNDIILRFNGGLFKEHRALPLKPEHLGLLIEAARADWRHVEPAIFGTFLEQALDPRERKKLGAEFTPRRWVERLVMPAVIEPLREQWNNVKATALAYSIAGNSDAAVKAVKAYHHELCHLRILDPACGSGNFLYAYTRISLIQRLMRDPPAPLSRFRLRRVQLQLNDPGRRDRQEHVNSYVYIIPDAWHNPNNDGS
jgi:hypothetical protein